MTGFKPRLSGIGNDHSANWATMVDTWLTEFRIDQIHVVLQKRYILYV